MSMKRTLIFLVCLASVGLAVAGAVSLGSDQQGGAVGNADGGGKSLAACLSETEISDALTKFTSESGPEIEQASTLLLEKSGESRECRSKIIAALMKRMDKPGLDFTSDKDSYYMWRYGAELLGDLKASEAIDLLASHLGLINRVAFSTTMNHVPALKGLIKIGPMALPKLDEVLRNNPDPKVRFHAVFCIANIGGPAAVNSLKGAFDSESDACVRRAISASLDSFDSGGNITDRKKWFSGLSCG